MSQFTPEDVADKFGFHKATIEGDNATVPKHREVRQMYQLFVSDLLDALGPERTEETEQMMTKLHEASMWTHFAIAKSAPVVQE